MRLRRRCVVRQFRLRVEGPGDHLQQLFQRLQIRLRAAGRVDDLLDDPDVTDAAVIGIPSAAWGETPLGLVVLTPGAETDGEAICARANEKLGKSQRLAGVETRETLPRSDIGKILKRDLRKPYWEGETE